MVAASINIGLLRMSIAVCGGLEGNEDVLRDHIDHVPGLAKDDRPGKVDTAL